MRVALIGIGSPFADDTLGWQLLDALEQQEWSVPGCTLSFAKVDRPGPGLLECFRGPDAVVLLDAVNANWPPGNVGLLDVAQLARQAGPMSSHHLGVAETLALGERLDMLPEHLYLLGIPMGSDLLPESVIQAGAVLAGLLEPLAGR